MIAYVSLVAVTNLILGMALAQYLSQSGAHTGDTKKKQRHDPRSVTDSLSTNDDEAVETEVTAVAITTVELNEDVPEETEVVTPADVGKPTLAALWREFSAQLRDISDRIRYCRTAQDIALAQQAASRLKLFVKEWYAQFEECLHREQPEESSQPAAAGQSLGAVEMFAAQLETTLSNIDALDFTLPVDDVLDLLNRELETLDHQRRGFAKSAESDK